MLHLDMHLLVETIRQVDDHVKIRLTSQLIKGISKVLQKLLKYFRGIERISKIVFCKTNNCTII